MKYDFLVATRSLYIHWPFCPYKCHFCPFVALASHDQFMTDYHNALQQEIMRFGQQCIKKHNIETIFIGGGTPSTYPIPHLLDMFGTLRTWFDIEPGAEISLEVNPGTVTQEKLIGWKSAGINRLSIGVQSLKDDVLKKLNRLQSAHDVYALLERAPQFFENISIDLIIGLPGVSAQEWQHIVQEVVTWPITHVSVYFLSVHENTPLYFGVTTKKISLPGDDEVVELYHWTVEMLALHGFMQYEISNFAKVGYESRHNTMYWERKPYKGFGLGACSFDGAKRLQNKKNLMNYLQNQSLGVEEFDFAEELTNQQMRLEKIMLGLRRAQGIAISELSQGLLEQEKERMYATLAWLQDNDFVRCVGERIVLTPAGLAVENEIVVKLSA